ncbi:hypothetical protein [Persicitalea jodogahamensis]|uniref:Uncharacterized protein n=1 Tax=Persicitalea jodogahamensis TaxID=402147 RepID=A0A8J3G8Z3_9BACT|nr:hypothetical protein [Persicitalea jodogahamensis]GHB59468.1 hypothetical protein GCM10007390_11410 [Persicitalea jodogahamensis]
MRNLLGVGFFLVIGIGLTLSGCVDTPNFDNTPSIRFNSVDTLTIFDSFSQTYADSIVITVDFEDGDGDLGISPEDRSDTTKLNTIYKEWGNYEITVLEKQKDGTFKVRPVSVFDKLFFDILKRDGKPGPIKGKLDFRQTLPASRFAKLTTVKFRVRIRDRAFNVSNTIETDTISVHLEQ